MYKKKCCMCQKPFETKYRNKQTCSFSCKQEKQRQNSRIIMRKDRHSKDRYKPCIICDYKEATDIHHEGKKTYILCPNHHALITRGIKTIKELLNSK